MYEEVLYEVKDAVATVTLNRPERLNALTNRLLAELRHALAQAEADTSVRGIILTGSGRGFTAGMDMALAIVEEDWGQAVALAVAQELVLYLKRPGGQSQFSRHLQAQLSETDRIQKLQLWILDHLDEELSVEQLAGQVAMSPRNFARRFKLDFKITPAKHVEQLRVEAARDKLLDTRLAIEKIASRCGFGCSETMRRSFLRVLGITPSEYRKRFRAAS